MAAAYKVLGQVMAGAVSTLTITNYIGAGTTTVTGTVASTAGYAIGDILTISGANTGTEQVKLNGVWSIASVPTGTTFTFVVTTSVTAGTLTTTLGTTTKASIVTLYTTPALTSTVCSTLVICNQGASTVFRVAVRPAGAALDPKHYLIVDNTINQYDSVFLTLGVSLATTDVVSVYAGATSVSFSVFGSELT
jgi:hypothetical protein